jgi:hypothetical protein
MANRILFHNNQNESNYLDTFENIFTITNKGNFDWKFEGKDIDNSLKIPQQFMEEFPAVVAKLKYLSPIFSRHYDDLPLMELHYRKIAFTVLQLATYLKPKQFDILFFPFSANHWIEGFILEIVGELLNLKIIFLYPIYIDFMLIPLVQTNGIESRKILSHKFTNNCVPNEILSKIQEGTHKQGYAKLENSIFVWEIKSKLIFVLYFSKKFLTNQLKKLAVHKAKKSREIKKPSIVTEMNILKEQIIATKYFLKIVQIDSTKLVAQTPKNIFGDPPIVIFAHYQPESSSFPEAGVNANTIDMVMKLRSRGYSGEIFYKEHPYLLDSLYSVKKYPTRIGTARSIEYYEQLRALDCRFIIDIPFGDKDYLVLTGTGTIALERSLRGFKSIVAGHPWYQGLPGTISLENFLCNNNEKKQFLNQDNIASVAFNYLESRLNNKLMVNGINIDMFNLKFEYKDIDKFRKEFNNLFGLLKEAKNLNSL